METRQITLADGATMQVPAEAWPWMTEYTWTYDAPIQQLYRIENGRVIYFFNELMKHSKTRELLVMSDGAVDAAFKGAPPYDKIVILMPRYVSLGQEIGILLPNPYELVANALARVLQIYYEWLLSGHRYVLSAETEQPDATLLRLPRDESYPYEAADRYPTLGAWMYGEWTGEFDSAGSAIAYIDHSHKSVAEVVKWMTEAVNVVHDYDEIVAFFDDQRCPLDELTSNIQLLIETYPTPAR
jgi:hypothetical protein